jgi:hypothetical protein
MIAVERTLLDLSAKFQRVEDNSLPSYQVNPLTSITFLPWNPCGYGYGGDWSDPCGYGFDSPYDFQSWYRQNNFDNPIQTGQIDWQQNRLVFISGGDYGLGYSLQVGDIFLRGGETIVQVTRGGLSTNSTQRSYVLLSLAREHKKYTVEYVVNGNDCYVDAGRNLPLANSGAWVLQSQKDWDQMSRAGARVPDSISNFDYIKNRMGLINMGLQPANVSYKIDRVAYRGQTAMVYMKKAVMNLGFNMNEPYFVLKFDRKIRSIKVVEL